MIYKELPFRNGVTRKQGVKNKIMNKNLLSLLALYTVIFAAFLKPAALWAAEPERLTASQMDTVTAGAVVIGMTAMAIAGLSPYPTYTSYTSTTTWTTVINPPTNIVQIGLGFGKAVACCGQGTYTDVQSMYYAEGDRVIANNMNINTTTPVFSSSFGFTTVIVVNTASMLPPSLSVNP